MTFILLESFFQELVNKNRRIILEILKHEFSFSLHFSDKESFIPVLICFLLPIKNKKQETRNKKII